MADKEAVLASLNINAMTFNKVIITIASVIVTIIVMVIIIIFLITSMTTCQWTLALEARL